MSASDRLAVVLGAEPAELDRVLAIVASIAPDPPGEDEVVGQFDELAAGLGPAPDGAVGHEVDAVVGYVFGQLGFIGNTANYYSPSNSFIHRVLRHRRGIPLTLAVLTVEIGRRVGADLSVVGLPGHVILGDGPSPSRWFDPFAAGAELNLEGCQRLFARFQPPAMFTPSMVAPIDAVAVATRMLTNLKLVYRRSGDLGQLAAVLELAVAVPASPISERYELAAVLAALGRDDLAAVQRELLITLDPTKADDHRRAVQRHRARRN